MNATNFSKFDKQRAFEVFYLNNSETHVRVEFYTSLNVSKWIKLNKIILVIIHDFLIFELSSVQAIQHANMNEFIDNLLNITTFLNSWSKLINIYFNCIKKPSTFLFFPFLVTVKFKLLPSRHCVFWWFVYKILLHYIINTITTLSIQLMSDYTPRLTNQ